MITLYPGSYIDVPSPLVGLGRKKVDFGQLRYKKVNHQMCILNQEIIDKYLTFLNSETVKD